MTPPPDEPPGSESDDASSGVPDTTLGGATTGAGAPDAGPRGKPGAEPRRRPGTTTSNPILAAGVGLTGPVQISGEPPRRLRTQTLFGDGGPVRGFLGRWGFPLFVLVILVLGRSVLLPFVFAALIAYILAPVVRWMCERKDGTRRMPRGAAIILCYLVFIAAIVGFGFLLVPRLAKDVQRIGAEAPALYKKIDEQWVPELARYLEKKFPSLRTEKAAVQAPPVVPDVPVPPDTAVTMTPLPDGRWAVQLVESGVVITPEPGGGFRVLPSSSPPAPVTLEEKLRAYVQKAMAGLQSQVDELARFGQALVTGIVKGVFTFFLVLMIGAFMLIDMEKVHAFLRSLFPPNTRDDYDVIIAGIDRGLSGVIRGQLLICLVNGILTYIGLLIFDIKYSLILALVAGLMSLIPIFGSILSTVPIVFAALVSGDSGLDFVRAVLSVLWIVGIHFIEANFLNPKIIGTAAKIHPVVVIFSLVLGERAFGLVGALLAVPVASTIQVLFLFFYRKTWKKDPGPPPLTAATG
jgi:predicted PurR-regulated permease PerM